MTCDCITKINEKLKSQNIQLTGYSYIEPSFEKRFVIETGWVEKKPKQPKKSPGVIASYCPFCGEKQSQTMEEDCYDDGFGFK